MFLKGLWRLWPISNKTVKLAFYPNADMESDIKLGGEY